MALSPETLVWGEAFCSPHLLKQGLTEDLLACSLPAFLP